MLGVFKTGTEELGLTFKENKGKFSQQSKRQKNESWRLRREKSKGLLDDQCDTPGVR